MGIAQNVVLFVFGTRPETIKLAPLIRLCRQDPEIQTRVCVTAQHRKLLDQSLTFFQIEPNADLNLMLPDQSLPGLAARVIEACAEVYARLQPALVVVQGDTTSAVAAAFSANLCRIPVAHVEAGLRSHRRDAPFPEEINRVLISRLAELHFVHSQLAGDNLRRENIIEGVHVVGNTVVDALKTALGLLDSQDDLCASRFPGVHSGRPFVLATLHRRENAGCPLANLCQGLRRIAIECGVDVYFPVHPNPRIRNPVYKTLSGVEKVHLLDPLTYAEFIWMLSKAALVVSDSGGVLEEAETLGVQVLVPREVTERTEALTSGQAQLVGSDPERLLATARTILMSPRRSLSSDSLNTTFGDGHASERILAITKNFLAALPLERALLGPAASRSST